MSLLEGLLAILIFSVGILALVALQSTSVRATTDAKFRADAGFLAGQLIASMWTSADPATFATYAYNTGGATCAFGGGGGNAAVTQWAGSVQRALPGSAAGMQQVIVTPGPDAPAQVDYRVTINICWQSGNDVRSVSTVTHIHL
jgi:type IV pilus assembly protein PilV